MKKGQGHIFFLIFLSMMHQGLASAPHPWQMNFQAAASPTMEHITHLHHIVLGIITVVVLLVFGLLAYVIFRFRESKNPIPSNRAHNTPLEIVWTAIPVLILFVIAFPSFKLTYFIDKVKNADMTIKIIGHQWYWTYEYPDEKVSFDSLLVADHDLKPGQLRLLEVDQPLVVPVGANIRLLMTSDDVIHSWSVPSLGIKQDNIPGRLRETWVRINREGTYYGQCSELCGKGHGFMPIAVKAVSKADYQNWLQTAKHKFSS